MMRRLFVLVFVLIVGGLTWLAVWPARWAIEQYGLLSAAVFLPIYFIIGVFALKWLEGPRR